jgi:hypothetical protein
VYPPCSQLREALHDDTLTKLPHGIMVDRSGWEWKRRLSDGGGEKISAVLMSCAVVGPAVHGIFKNPTFVHREQIQRWIESGSPELSSDG